MLKRFVALTILAGLVGGSAAFVYLLPEPRVGDLHEVAITYGRGLGDDRRVHETDLALRVVDVKVTQAPWGGGLGSVWVAFWVKNNGRKAINFQYGIAQLRDAEAREFLGMSWADAHGKPSQRSTMISLEPGQADETSVWFHVPAAILSGDLHFGLVSVEDEDELQARTLVVERGSAAQATSAGR